MNNSELDGVKPAQSRLRALVKHFRVAFERLLGNARGEGAQRHASGAERQTRASE